MQNTHAEFVKAIIDDENSLVSTLITPTMDLDALEAYEGMPMLHYLVKYGKADILRIFLRNGAHLDVLDQDQVSVADRIRQSENPQLISVLEDHLAYVAKVDQDLQDAIAANDFSGLEASAQQERDEKLSEKAFRADVLPYCPHPLLDAFTRDMTFEAFCDEFVKIENPFHYCNRRRETLLHLAVKYQRNDVLTLLSDHVDFEKNANNRDLLGRTALHHAMIQGDLKAYHKLSFATPKSYLVRCYNGMSILHYAAQYGHIDILCDLFSGVQKVLVSTLYNIADASGKLALHYAASQSKSSECLRILLENETAELAIDLRRNTPLHYATVYGIVENVELCLRANLSPYQRNSEGKSAFDLAIEFGHHNIAEMMIRYALPSGPGLGYQAIQSEQDRIQLYLVDQYILKNQLDEAIELLSTLVESKDKHVSILSRLKMSENIVFSARNDYLSQLYPSAHYQYINLGDESAVMNFLDVATAQDQTFLQVLCLAALGDVARSKEQCVVATHLYNSALVLYGKCLPTIRLGGDLFQSVDEQYLIDRISMMANSLYRQMAVSENYDYKRIAGYRGQLKRARGQCVFTDVLGAQNNHSIMTECYRQIVGDIIEVNSRLLKMDPASFSAVVCGSVARQETALFSDIEYLLLTKSDDPSLLDACEKLSQLVALDLINLGETDFKVLDRGKRSVIQAGLSLDPHGITPRGRVDINSGKSISEFRLIGTARTIAQLVNKQMFLSERELVVSLCTTAHLFGNADLSHGLCQAITRQIDGRPNIVAALSQFFKPEVTIRTTVSQQCLLALTDEFKPKLDHVKNQEKFFMVKQELYRVLERFISSLALLTKCPSSRSWDRITYFQEKGIVTEQAAKNLHDALNMALLIRMRVQNHYQSEFDGMWHLRSASNEYVLPFGMTEHDVYLMGQADVNCIQSVFQTLSTISDAINHYVATGYDLSVFQKMTFSTYLNQTQGSYFSRLHNYEEASNYYEKAIALNPNSVVTLASYMKTLSIRGDYEKAVVIGLEAMRRWDGQNVENDINYGLFLNNLAHAMPYTGRYAQAKEVMLKAFEVVNRLMPNSPFVHTMLIGLIDFTSDQSEKKRLLSMCEKIEQKILVVDPVMIAKRIQSQADSLLAEQKTEEALSLVNQAIDVLKQSGHDSRILLVELFTLKATAIWGLGHPETALTLYEQALAMAEKVHGQWHTQTECCINDLGVCYLRMNQPQKALGYFDKALKINLTVSPGINQYLGVRYNCLARAHLRLGDPNLAIELEQKAVEADKAYFGVDTTETLIRLGDLMAVALGHDMAVWDEANAESVAILERINPERVSSYLQSSIHVLQGISDHQRCIKYILLLLPHVQDQGQLAMLYNNLGAMSLLVGDVDSAMMYQQIALSLQTDSSVAISNQAINYRKQQQYDQAIEAHLKSIELEKAQNEQDTVMLGKFYSYTAQTCYEAGKADLAEHYYWLAIEVFRKHYDNDAHPLIENCLGMLQMIKFAQMMALSALGQGAGLESMIQGLTGGGSDDSDGDSMVSRMLAARLAQIAQMDEASQEDRFEAGDEPRRRPDDEQGADSRREDQDCLLM